MRKPEGFGANPSAETLQKRSDGLKRAWAKRKAEQEQLMNNPPIEIATLFSRVAANAADYSKVMQDVRSDMTKQEASIAMGVFGAAGAAAFRDLATKRIGGADKL